ncbi:MAG: hypothetical protein U0930_17235 [Pirellulales bacterium]
MSPAAVERTFRTFSLPLTSIRSILPAAIAISSLPDKTPVKSVSIGGMNLRRWPYRRGHQAECSSRTPKANRQIDRLHPLLNKGPAAGIVTNDKGGLACSAGSRSRPGDRYRAGDVRTVDLEDGRRSPQGTTAQPAAGLAS